MRQEHKLTSKKRIIILSILGIIPFYFELIFYLFSSEIYNNSILKIRGATIFYGVLIICFLSGMHWERIISQKKIKFYILPMIPIILLWTSFLFSTNYNFYTLIIIGLLWCLYMDVIFFKKISHWFVKMRIIITIFALAPIFTIFFLH